MNKALMIFLPLMLLFSGKNYAEEGKKETVKIEIPPVVSHCIPVNVVEPNPQAVIVCPPTKDSPGMVTVIKPGEAPEISSEGQTWKAEK